MDEHLIAKAARNNALWCHAICRLNGVEGEFRDDAWTSAERTPTHYPDAVTLRRSVDASSVLNRVDASAGCSVKDCFADLDLVSRGFETLFDAPWIHFASDATGRGAGTPEWGLVDDIAALVDWEGARGRGDPEHRSFPPGLLSRPGLLVLAAREQDRIVAGAVLCSGAGVVSLADLFAVGTELTDAYSGAAAAAVRFHPGKALVGYESDAELAAAEQAGFKRIGRLVVWLRS